MKNLNLAVALVLALALSAQAEKESGGADAFVCKTKTGEVVHLADIFPLVRGGGFDYVEKEVAATRPGWVTSTAMAVIYSRSPEEARALTEIMNKFKYDNNENLPELDDDGIHEIPAGCSKTQLAIQKLATGAIEVKTSLRNRLSVLEQGLFPIHEAYIKYYAEDVERTGNTSKIREALYKTVSSPDFLRTFQSPTPGIWFLIRVEDGVDAITGKPRTVFRPDFHKEPGTPQGVFRGTLLTFTNSSSQDCSLVTSNGEKIFDTMWAKNELWRNGKYTGSGFFVITQVPGTIITYRCAERPWHETGLIIVF